MFFLLLNSLFSLLAFFFLNRDFTFGQISGGDSGGWNVISSSETSDDGKARTEKLLATTEGVSAVDGGKKAFSGRNEELRSERFDGDANNFTYSSGESSNTEVKENIVTGDENSKRIESKSSFVSSSSQTFKSSTNSSNVDNHNFDLQQQQQQQAHNQNNQSQQHESMTSSSSDHKSETMQLSQEPNTVREAFRLAQQPGKILSRHVERANETTNMITERKELVDGTIVTTKRYESIGGENLTSSSNNTSSSMKSETKFKTLKDEEAFKLAQEPGKLLSRDITMKDPTTRLIVEKKELSDGTVVTTKRYETVSDTIDESRSEFIKSSTMSSKTQSREEDAFRKTEKAINRPTPAVRESIMTTKHHETVNNKSQTTSENEKQTQREVVEEKITQKIYDTSCHCPDLHDHTTPRSLRTDDFLKNERSEPYDVNAEIITNDHVMQPTPHREDMQKLSDVRKIEQKRVEEQMRVRKESVDKKITRDLEQDAAHKAFASSLRSVTPPIDRAVPLPRTTKEREHTRSPSRESTTSNNTKKSAIHDVTKIDRRSSNRSSVTSERQQVSSSSKKVTSESRKSTGEIIVDENGKKSAPKSSRNTSPQKLNNGHNAAKKSTKRDQDEHESEIFSSTITIDNKEKQQDDLKIVQTIDTRNLSATTSVSDLEFVVPSKREKSLVTDLDDNVQIRINLNNMKDADDLEIKTTVSEVRRTSSPDKESHRREFKRSETFEERVKKLIGCDENDTLVTVSSETPHYAKPTFASHPNGSSLRVSEIRERKAKIERESQEIEKTASRRKSSLTSAADFIEREKSENMKSSSVYIASSSSDNSKTTTTKNDDVRATKMEAKTSQKAPETHVTVAKITISPTKSSSSPMTSSSSTIKTTSVTQINRTVKDTPTTRHIVRTAERDSDNETDQELVRIMDKSADGRTARKKLITNRKDSAPVKSSSMQHEKDKVARSISERTFKTDIVVKPLKSDTATPKKDSKRPTKCVSTKTINLTNLNVNQTINSSTLDDVVIDVQQAKSSREPSPNKVIPVPVKPDEFINGHDMIYPDKITEPEEEHQRRVDEPIKPKVRNIPIFEEDTKTFVGLEITEVATEKSRVIVEESEEQLETINSSTLEVADRKRNSIQIEPIEDEGDEHAHLMSVSQKVNKFIETAEMLKQPSPAPQSAFKNEKVKLRDNSDSFKQKITKFANTTDETILREKKSKRIPDDIMIRSYDETLKNDDCLLSVSDKVQKFISSAEKLTSSEPQKSPELVKNAMKGSRRDHKSNESFLTSEKQQSSAHMSSSTISRDDRSDSKSTVKSGGSDITLKSTEAIKRARAVFENSSTAQRDVKRHDDIMSRPSVFESRRSGEEKSKSPSPSSLRDRRGSSSDSPRTPAYMRDQVSTKKDLFEKKISSSKLETETMLTRKSLSPQTSVDDSRGGGHSVSENSHTVTRRTSADKHYMSHTLASLEHCQKERKDSEVTRTSRRGSSTSPVKYQRNVSESTNESHHVVDAPPPSKSTSSSSTKAVKSRRTSSNVAANVEAIDIESIIDLEELEKLLEVVVGYEQRRRIRAQIRVVKKMMSDKEEKQQQKSSNSVHVKKVSTSSQARRVSTGGTESLAQTRQVTKIMTTVEKPLKNESKTTQRTTVTTSSATKEQKQQISSADKPRETSTRLITSDKSPRGIIETFNSKCTKPVESVVKIVKKTSTTSSSHRANAALMKETRIGNDVTDSVTSSYGVGPTDSNGLPLFGLRALKKKDASTTKSELSDKHVMLM